jgi:hypothetical protein
MHHFEVHPRSLDFTSRYYDPNVPTTPIAYTSQTIKKIFNWLRAIPSENLHDQDAASSPNGQYGAEEQWTRVRSLDS